MTGWLIMYQNQSAADKAFLRAEASILELYDALKGDVGNQKQTEDNTDLTTHENEEGPSDGYIRVDTPFNNLMRAVFQLIK